LDTASSRCSLLRTVKRKGSHLPSAPKPKIARIDVSTTADMVAYAFADKRRKTLRHFLSQTSRRSRGRMQFSISASIRAAAGGPAASRCWTSPPRGRIRTDRHPPVVLVRPWLSAFPEDRRHIRSARPAGASHALMSSWASKRSSIARRKRQCTGVPPEPAKIRDLSRAA